MIIFSLFISFFNLAPAYVVVAGVALMIAPRAALWQLIPELTLVSIFALQVADSPLVGFPRCEALAPEYFTNKSWDELLARAIRYTV